MKKYYIWYMSFILLHGRTLFDVKVITILWVMRLQCEEISTFGQQVVNLDLASPVRCWSRRDSLSEMRLSRLRIL